MSRRLGEAADGGRDRARRRIRFAFNDDKGVTRTLTGTVRGHELTGTLKSAGGAETKSPEPQVVLLHVCFTAKAPRRGAFLFFGTSHDRHSRFTHIGDDHTAAPRRCCRSSTR